VYVDAYPNRYFNGTLTRVYEKAEFTPKNVETKEERVKLVFGAEVSVENPEGLLKPGMPADVVIKTDPKAEWVKP
jgi:HlyD family secretion protein